MKNHLERQVGTNFNAKLAGQSVSKKDNLTLGGLRCTTLALKRALGPAKESPRGPKKAMKPFDTGTRGVMLEPLGPPKVS